MLSNGLDQRKERFFGLQDWNEVTDSAGLGNRRIRAGSWWGGRLGGSLEGVVVGLRAAA